MRPERRDNGQEVIIIANKNGAAKEQWARTGRRRCAVEEKNEKSDAAQMTVPEMMRESPNWKAAVSFTVNLANIENELT